MSVTRDRTLLKLLLFLGGALALLAVADYLRGTGGRSWLSAADAVDTPAESSAEGTYFRDVALFDGREWHESVNVLVRDGLIVSVGETDDSAGAEIVDGAGKTLLPGLIDAHTHVFGPVLPAALAFGVTTEIDMFTDAALAAQLRAEQVAGGADGRADLVSAGVLATSPGGHGTEYGMTIPTLSAPEEADAFVQARRDEGSDFLKIVYDGGSLGRQFTSLDLPTVRALIAAAHARDMLAVVHVARERDALDVIAAGADGIVHAFYDRPASANAVEQIQASGAFVIPTLSVLESVAGLRGGDALLADQRIAPWAGPLDRMALESAFPAGPGRDQSLANALQTIGALQAAGVRILAGTDAPNPGTAHGISLHRELELLVRAGLTPAQALRAATFAPAEAFGLSDRGRVEPGARADLLLVGGDPMVDVTRTREIVGIWKGGIRFDRRAYRASLESAAAAAAGMISDFESGAAGASFGTGWTVSTDQMIGGTSEATMQVVDGGAAGTGKALQTSGVLEGESQNKWAGPMLLPGAQAFAPADLSAGSGFELWIRGDAGTYAVMVFSANLGQVPAMKLIEVGTEWQLLSLPFADFAGVDAKKIQGLLVTPTAAGAFSFTIDEIALR